MFARRLSVTYLDEAGVEHPCPLAWIDNFAMRNFTNDAVFDDTLPGGRRLDGSRYARAARAIAICDGKLVSEEGVSESWLAVAPHLFSGLPNVKFTLICVLNSTGFPSISVGE